jgi:hypothetical protein
MGSEDSRATHERGPTAGQLGLLAGSQQGSFAAYEIKFRSGRRGRDITFGHEQDAPGR